MTPVKPILEPINKHLMETRDGADELDRHETGGHLAELHLAQQPRREGQDEQHAQALDLDPVASQISLII